MSLDEYTRKRDFTTSPEPAGDRPHRSPTGRTPRRFCVQKHLASHLHYDLRLEHDGVLLSWAVPKGPSLDPATKRLAMHVEDHPIDYGAFEGVIPSGYGAGIVMLWDEGTWTPEVDDVDAALKKGDLKFTLDGVKLKGSWVLVRTRGWRGGGVGRPVVAAHQAPRRVGRRRGHHHLRAAQREERRRLRRHSRAGGPGHLGVEPPARGGDSAALFERIVRRRSSMRVRGAAAPATSGRTATGASGRHARRRSGHAAPRPTAAAATGRTRKR
jgi:DNA ligase D-like protein (predicted 3'-phosphoesterase)